MTPSDALTVFHIAASCGGIIALFVFLAWLANRMSMRPPVEDAPPASWLARMEERG